MSNLEDALKLLLKNRGYSLTKPRLVVFDKLLGQEPLTMSDLIIRIDKQVDRASVYRAIQVFEDTGIVQRLYTGWKYKIELTDSFAAHHHHLTCSKCGQIIPINEHGVEDFIQQLASQYKFQLQSHQLEVQGLCQKCSLKLIGTAV